MLLYRAVSYLELVEILLTRELRPGPPSFQGKWFAETLEHAVVWGVYLSRLGGSEPFHIIEVEVVDTLADGWFRIPKLDGIGPARYSEIPDLSHVKYTREIKSC